MLALSPHEMNAIYGQGIAIDRVLDKDGAGLKRPQVAVK